MADSDEYELIPEKEIGELKDELKRLKDFEVKPTKQLGTNLIELNTKIEQLLSVFEQSYRFMTTEGSGENKELIERLDKVLEENGQIAQGLVALSDMISGLKDKVDLLASLPKSASEPQSMPEPPSFNEPPAPMPDATSQPLPGMLPPLSDSLPPLPPPPKRGFFG